MKLAEKMYIIVGVLIVLFGLTMVIGSIDPAPEADDGPLFNLLFFLGFGILPILVGCWIVYRMFRSARLRNSDHSENELLLLAKRFGGRLTAPEYAMHSNQSIEICKTKLEAYVATQICTRKIAENGTIVYEFPELLSDEDKRRAKSIYEA